MSTASALKQPPTFSIKDQKAVSDRLLPQLPRGFIPKGLHVSEWKIKDWLSTSPTSLKRSSPDFESGGHKWQIHLFPLGLVKPRQQEQIIPTPKTAIGLYIVHSDNCQHSEPWKVEADIIVAICNSQTPSVFIKQTYHHQFTPTTALAGSHDFRRLRDIVRPRRAGLPSIMVNGVADVVVHLRTSEAVLQGRLAARKKANYAATITTTPTTGVIEIKGRPRTPSPASSRDSTPSKVATPAAATPQPQTPDLALKFSLDTPQPHSSERLANEEAPLKNTQHLPASGLHPMQDIVGDLLPIGTFPTETSNSPTSTTKQDADQDFLPYLHESISEVTIKNDRTTLGLNPIDLVEPDSEDHAQHMPQEPSVAVSSTSHRGLTSPCAAAQERLVETLLEVTQEEDNPRMKAEGPSDESYQQSTQERPVKRKKYCDALDLVLSKAITDQKRSELKIGHLERSLKGKDEKIKTLKSKMRALMKEKCAVVDQLIEKNHECLRLHEEIQEIVCRKDVVNQHIARFSNDLERALGQ